MQGLGWFTPQQYGALGNGIQDDTAYVQAALDAAALVGGTVWLARGTYKISAALTMHDSVQLLCESGADYFFGSASFATGAVLVWAGGAAAVLTVTPSAVGRPCVAPRIENLAIDGQGVATYCLRIEATVQGVFRNLALRAAVTSALLTTQTALGGFVGLNYVYGCEFTNIWIDQNAVGLGDGVQLDGNATGAGDTTFCRFSNLEISHLNGVGVKVVNADTNVFEVVNCSRQGGGTGIGIDLRGNNAGGNGSTNNVFTGVYPGAGGVTARGVGLSNPSKRNMIIGYSLTDSAVLPTIEAGASLVYTLYNGDVFGGSPRDAILTRGQGFAGENFSRAQVASSGAMVSGTIYFQGVALLAGDVITNLHPRIITAGAGITACRVGLYDAAGNRVAQSNDLGVSWQTGGLKTNALSAPYTVPTTGMYYVALFCTFTTTAPAPARAGAVTGVFEAIGAGAMLEGTQAGQASLVTPATIANANQFAFWVGWS